MNQKMKNIFYRLIEDDKAMRKYLPDTLKELQNMSKEDAKVVLKELDKLDPTKTLQKFYKLNDERQYDVIKGVEARVKFLAVKEHFNL